MALPVVQPSCLCRGGSIVEHKRWCALSYDEAKDLAIEAKAFRERKNVAPGRFPGYLRCVLDVLFFAFFVLPKFVVPVPFEHCCPVSCQFQSEMPLYWMAFLFS